MTVASFVVLTTAGVIAILCWLNFDKGLAHYRTYYVDVSVKACMLTSVYVVHVEGVLAQSDFQPEMFTNNDVEKSGTAWLPHDLLRCKESFKSTTSIDDDTIDIGGSLPVRSLSIKKDSNWDFNRVDADLNTPAIYVVELDIGDRTFKELSPVVTRDI